MKRVYERRWRMKESHDQGWFADLIGLAVQRFLKMHIGATQSGLAGKEIRFRVEVKRENSMIVILEIL